MVEISAQLPVDATALAEIDRWLTKHSFAWELEDQSLAKLHAVLDPAVGGLPIAEISERTGLGRGYLLHLLKDSCVFTCQGKLWFSKFSAKL